LMNWLSMRSATRVFVTIPDWATRFRSLGVWSGRREPPIVWIPVSSNIPDITDAHRVQDIRAMFSATGARMVVGHFGIFGRYHSQVLPPVVIRILDDTKTCGFLLIGRNSDTMRNAIVVQRPDLASRIIAAGGLAPEAVSSHIAACDVMLQPYDDGVSSRRTSLMAALALGRPVVTNRGVATSDVWTSRDAVLLTASAALDDLGTAVHTMLGDAPLRQRLGTTALKLHREVFALERGVAALRDTATPCFVPMKGEQ